MTPTGHAVTGRPAAARARIPITRVPAAIGLAGLLVAVQAALLVALALLSLIGAPGQPWGTDEPLHYGVSALALKDIPPEYLRSYQKAGVSYGIDWAIIAAIGRLECDHGRLPDLSCSRPGRQNSAGAGGPMQLLAATWAGEAVDGNADGVKDRWDYRDAIPTAANYLRDAGAPADYRRAIFA